MENGKIILLILLITGLLSVSWEQASQKNQPDTMELVPMMRLLMSDTQMINEGIYTGNYKLIEEGGRSITEHPVMTEKDKELVKRTLGEEFTRFVNYDMTVHHHADSVAQAAQHKDMQEVMQHYRIVQQGCVDCHTDFRKQVMEARK